MNPLEDKVFMANSVLPAVNAILAGGLANDAFKYEGKTVLVRAIKKGVRIDIVKA